MNVGMLACYDQAKEVVAKLTNDPMTNGPSLATKMGSSCIAVSDVETCTVGDALTHVNLTMSILFLFNRALLQHSFRYRLT